LVTHIFKHRFFMLTVVRNCKQFYCSFIYMRVFGSGLSHFIIIFTFKSLITCTHSCFLNKYINFKYGYRFIGPQSSRYGGVPKQQHHHRVIFIQDCGLGQFLPFYFLSPSQPAVSFHAFRPIEKLFLDAFGEFFRSFGKCNKSKRRLN